MWGLLRLSDCQKTFCEPCPCDPCANREAVQSLFPDGVLWINGETTQGYIDGLSEVFTAHMSVICDLQKEVMACESFEMLDMWACEYMFPSCKVLSKEALCQWINIVTDPTCARGSVGFIKKLLWFVDPTVKVGFNNISKDVDCCAVGCDKCQADIVFSAPKSTFRYVDHSQQTIGYIQDKNNPCRYWYIPAVECLRKDWLPVWYTTAYDAPIGQRGFCVIIVLK